MTEFDNLILFLHNCRIDEFIVFEKFNNQYELIFSFPVQEKIDFNLLDLNKYTYKSLKIDNSYEISILFKFNQLTGDNSYIIEIAIETIKSCIYKELLNFKKIYNNLLSIAFKTLFIDIDEFMQKIFNTLNTNNEIEHCIIYINNSVHKIEKFFVFSNNGNFTDSLPFPLKIDDIQQLNEEEFKKKLKHTFLDSFLFFPIKIDTLSGIKATFILFFKVNSIYNSISKRINLKNQFKEIIGNLLYFYFFIKEQDYYIQQLEKMLYSKKEEVQDKNIKILKQINELSRNEKAKSTLFTNVYHHLITPLNSIIGFTMYLINFNKHKFEPEILESMYSIESNTYYLYFFILNIITYTKHISDDFKLNNENFLFLEIASQFKRILIFFKNNFNFKVSMKVPNKDFYFYSDKNAIQQIIFSFILFFANTKSPHLFFEVGFDKSNSKDKGKTLLLKFSFENSKIYEGNLNKINNYFSKNLYYNANNFELETFTLFVSSILLRELKGTFKIIQNPAKIIINLKIPETKK